MARGIMLVMDSFGIGASEDAVRFGDSGADTLGHIAEICARGEADLKGIRSGPLYLPHLQSLGLGEAAGISTGHRPAGFQPLAAYRGAYGYAKELSRGKDTPSGHWEMAGVPVDYDWGYFPNCCPTFPKELTDRLIQEGNLPGILGNRHASGTVIIEELGAQHMETGKPIIYTSADSVFQIAAHEETFGLERLYALCQIARRIVDHYQIGRVIARPFIGEPGHFRRTANRKDLAVPPPSPTLLDRLVSIGREVVGIGKISDIFSGRGVTQKRLGDGNMALFDATLEAIDSTPEDSLIFTNFVDFDMLFGHRRNVAGYAAALEAFDRRLPELWGRLRQDDLAIISADHGCDPSWPGTDHTREHVPVLAFGPRILNCNLGGRDSFADIGQTIAEHLGTSLEHGVSFLKQIMDIKEKSPIKV